jgi:hypothetical protein
VGFGEPTMGSEASDPAAQSERRLPIRKISAEKVQKPGGCTYRFALPRTNQQADATGLLGKPNVIGAQ